MRQEVRWTDLTYEQIAEHLAEAGTPVSVPVVKQLLRTHGYVTRKAQKSKAMGGHPDRDQQFENIARLKRGAFLEGGFRRGMVVDSSPQEVCNRGAFPEPPTIECLAMPTIPQRIASAFPILFGQYGDVTKM